MDDYYAILGVSRNAEGVVIKAAWRALAQKYHPDKYDGPPDVARQKMQEINAAYDVLSDPARRSAYDEAFSRTFGEANRKEDGGASPPTEEYAADTIPDSARGWSWGAFLLNWIWAINNRTWIGLLSLVPYLGLIMAVVLGFKGKEWAWKNNQWKSVEHFDEVQKKWSFWGVTIVGGLFSIGVIAAVLIPATTDRQRASAGVRQEAVTPLPSANPEPPVSSAATNQPAGGGQQGSQAHSVETTYAEELQQVALASVRAYPFLDSESPNANVQAIKDVIERRDIYVASGYTPPNALRMAVSEIGPTYEAMYREMYQRRAATVQRQRAPTYHEQQEARLNGCQPKSVMSDEEIAKCQSR